MMIDIMCIRLFCAEADHQNYKGIWIQITSGCHDNYIISFCMAADLQTSKFTLDIFCATGCQICDSMIQAFDMISSTRGKWLFTLDGALLIWLRSYWWFNTRWHAVDLKTRHIQLVSFFLWHDVYMYFLLIFSGIQRSRYDSTPT